MVLDGARLLAVGLAIGLAGAAVASTVLRGFLFSVEGRDPLTFAAAPALLGMAALCASYLPARRAARVSPASALRR